MARHEPKTARELLAELEHDPRHRAMIRAQDEDLRRRAQEWAQAEAPILEELAQAGFPVESVWQLVATEEPYPAAIPILVRHLERDYPGRVREGIARALTVPESRGHFRELLRAFLDEKDQRPTGPKWGLACAMAMAARLEDIEAVIRIVGDPRHGELRVPLLAYLARADTSEARSALTEASRDPALARELRQLAIPYSDMARFARTLRPSERGE